MLQLNEGGWFDGLDNEILQTILCAQLGVKFLTLGFILGIVIGYGCLLCVIVMVNGVSGTCFLDIACCVYT